MCLRASLGAGRKGSVVVGGVGRCCGGRFGGDGVVHSRVGNQVPVLSNIGSRNPHPSRRLEYFQFYP